MKDPAFLFYSSDFLTGCCDLTMEERGQYITILCLQHQKGHLSEKTIRLSVGSVSVFVLDKFLRDENGNYFNKRLEIEIEKRNKFTASRINNGKKGGRPPKNEKPKNNLSVIDSLTYAKPTQNLPENENIINNKVFNINSNTEFNLVVDNMHDEVYKEQFCMKVKISIIQYDQFLDDFLKSLELSGKYKEMNISDIKLWFLNSVKKSLKDGTKYNSSIEMHSDVANFVTRAVGR